jgi:hypothetical protein
VFAFAPLNQMTLLIDGQPETSDMGRSSPVAISRTWASPRSPGGR